MGSDVIMLDLDADLDLTFAGLPLAVRRALAIREHLLTLVAEGCVVVGLLESTSPGPDQTVVVALDLDSRIDCQVMMFAGTCDHAWWTEHCTLVPLVWERMTPRERAVEVRTYTTAKDRAAMRRHVTHLQRVLAELDDLTAN